MCVYALCVSEQMQHQLSIALQLTEMGHVQDHLFPDACASSQCYWHN